MIDPEKSLVAIDKQLRETPECQIVEEIRGFSRSLALFDGNYRELKGQLAFFEDAQQSMRLEQAGHEEEKQHFQAEVMRLIHNYVAAAFSLVDHSRRHYRKLYSNGGFPEYLERVKAEFADDPLANFVKGLRNHFQHYGLPWVYFQTSLSRGDADFKRTIHLRNDALKDFEWDAKAKKYLYGQTEDINLGRLVDQYQRKVTSFYEWFQIRQEELHAAEFEMVEAVRVKMRRMALPDILNATLQFPGINAETFESSIRNFLGYEEQVVFALMEPSSKAKFLLIVLKSITDISPGIEKRIRRLYPG